MVLERSLLLCDGKVVVSDTMVLTWYNGIGVVLEQT